jgi:hypothetical protein
MSVAAWKGFIQLITNPFYWEKTEHGLHAPAAAAAAPQPAGGAARRRPAQAAADPRGARAAAGSVAADPQRELVTAAAYLAEKR